jgi:predicted dehydrogenase
VTAQGDGNGDALRVGLIGCGRLTEQGYLHALAEVDSARLVGLADPDPIRRERAAGIAASLGDLVPTYRGIASLLAGARPDALVLASPAAAHVAGAREATAAGVPVLVEKPPAPDVDGAAELAALDPPPWMAFNRRYSRGIPALRARVHGTDDIDLDLSIAYRRQSWRAHVVDDDALDDLGPHLVDWVRWLTGQAVLEVATHEISPGHVVADLTLERGRAHIAAAMDRMHHERIECRGRDGRRVARWSAGGPVRAVTGRLRPGPHPLVAGLAAELDAFADVVRGRPSPDLATAADGLAVMQVIAAVRASAARDGSPVPVHPPEVP